MKVGVFNCTLSSSDPKRKVFVDFAKGVLEAGDDSFVQEELAYKDCDVAVIFGAVRRDKVHKRDLHNLKADIINKHQKDNSLLVFDNPVIGRKLTNVNDSNPYLRIGINSFMNDEGIFNNLNSPSDRWEKIKQQLNIDVKPWREDGEHILIMLQKFNDASLRGDERTRPENHVIWARTMAQQIRLVSERPVIFRPHPEDRSSSNYTKIQKIANEYNCTLDTSNTDVVNSLKNCWACVTFSSGSAVDALLEGVPTVVSDSGSMAYPICDHSCLNIENISMNDRTQWLYDLSYTQWHINEMSLGLPWMHLKPKLEELQ